jgi:hypothetical protein
MKGRDFIIGAAVGLWLVVAFGGQHGQASPPAAPVTSAPPPSATSSPAVSAPATSSPAVSAPATPLPQGSPTAPPQAGPPKAGASPGPAVSGGLGWFILAVFCAVIVISVSTVVVTAANGRRAT